MPLSYKNVTGKYLECWTSGYPRWVEVPKTVSIRSGDSSYRQATPKRIKPKGLEILFKPTSHYCDSVVWCDSAARVNASAAPMACSGTYWTPNGNVVQSAGARRRWEDVGMTSGSNPAVNYLANYQNFNPTYDKVWSEVKSEKVNLAMMLAEYRQTGSMFADLAKELLSLVRSVRKGQFRQFVGKRHGPHNDWLMYRYGITPLLGDINAITETLMSSNAKPLIHRFRGKNKSVVVEKGFHRPSGSYVGTLENLPWQIVDTTICRDVIFIEYSQSNLTVLSQTGFLNPLALGWELIPFSFVVDWFLNIGDQLSNLDALTGVKRWAGTRAKMAERNLDYLGVPWSAKGRRYTRSVITSGPTLSVPRWDPSLTWKKVVDAQALLHGKLRPHMGRQTPIQKWIIR